MMVSKGKMPCILHLLCRPQEWLLQHFQRIIWFSSSHTPNSLHLCDPMELFHVNYAINGRWWRKGSSGVAPVQITFQQKKTLKCAVVSLRYSLLINSMQCNSVDSLVFAQRKQTTGNTRKCTTNLFHACALAVATQATHIYTRTPFFLGSLRFSPFVFAECA